MKCIHCGYVIPTDSEFCPYCGGRVVASPPPAPTPESVPTPTVPISDAPEKPREDRDRITQAQRYFDPDYGYSAENYKSVEKSQYKKLHKIHCTNFKIFWR